MFFAGLLSIVGGILFFLSFPPVSFGFLIWFFLVPVFFAGRKFGFFGKFLTGFTAFFTGHFLNLYWIYPTVRWSGESVFVSFIALFLLSLLLAFLDGFLIVFANEKPLVVSAVAVAIGFIKTKFLSGFPWCALYVALVPTTKLMSSARFFGPFFLTFLIVFFNHSLYKSLSAKRARYFVIAVSLFALNFFLSFFPLVAEKREKKRITVCQLNVPQQEKWNAAKVSLILDRIDLFAKIARRKSDLVVFPESSLPGCFGYDKYADDFVDALEQKDGSSVLIGAIFFRKNKLYNSAVLVDSSGKQFYFKRKLVPFGEFVPMRKILGGFVKVLNDIGDFEKGNSAKTLVADNMRISPLICSEVIFPSLWHGDGNIIVNITNDAWFGRTAAARQHLNHARILAAASGLPVVFANNRGPSAIIDGTGRIIGQSGIYEMTLLSAEVPLPPRGSFYHRHFDLTLPVVFIGIVMEIFRRKKWMWKSSRN